MAVSARAVELLGDDGVQIYEGTNQLNRLAVIEALWEADLARA